MANKTKAQKEAEAAAVAAATQGVPEDSAQANPGENQQKAPSKVIALKGDRVFFHREVNTGNGVKLISEPGILVKKAAAESMLPENSFDVGIFTNVYQVRFGVMHSPLPKGNHWSYVSID